MAKTPQPGRVKTRLAQEIGPVAAAWWYRHQVRGLIRRLRDRRWDIVVALSPDCDAAQAGQWFGATRVIAQGGGDLGQRMARHLRAARGPVCLIGSDIPGVSQRHICCLLYTSPSPRD